MFKNCKKSVCSTNSIVVTPNPRKVAVVRHSKSESAAANQCPNQGTNQWLKNGGVLPLVAVNPNTKKLPPSPVKQPAKTVKVGGVPKQTKELRARQPTEIPTSTKLESPSQAVLKPLNATYTTKKSDKEEPIEGTEKVLVFDKENYANIISHFNDQYLMDPYNPAEYCEKKLHYTSPCVTRPPQATSAPEKVHYSEEAKAEVLRSIREELNSWKNDDEAKENQLL